MENVVVYSHSGAPGACSVCLETIATGDEVARMPCFHSFHSACVNNWLIARGTCPECRHQVMHVHGAGDDGVSDAEYDDENDEYDDALSDAPPPVPAAAAVGNDGNMFYSLGPQVQVSGGYWVRMVVHRPWADPESLSPVWAPEVGSVVTPQFHVVCPGGHMVVPVMRMPWHGGVLHVVLQRVEHTDSHECDVIVSSTNHGPHVLCRVQLEPSAADAAAAPPAGRAPLSDSAERNEAWPLMSRGVDAIDTDAESVVDVADSDVDCDSVVEVA